MTNNKYQQKYGFIVQSSATNNLMNMEQITSNVCIIAF